MAIAKNRIASAAPVAITNSSCRLIILRRLHVFINGWKCIKTAPCLGDFMEYEHIFEPDSYSERAIASLILKLRGKLLKYNDDSSCHEMSCLLVFA